MIIKFFLIGVVVAVAAWLLRGEGRGSRLALTRLAGITVTACWVAAVLAPDAVTIVANHVGVGRGADLVLYVLVGAFMFTTIAGHQRARRLEDRLARLTRAHALLEQQVEELDPEQLGAEDRT